MTRATERHLQESLSAAIDGEAEPLELRRVLNAAAEDADLRARWRSAHVIGSVIRGEAPATETPPPQLDGAGSPHGAGNRTEPRGPGRQWRWLGPVAGGAVAASAALAVVLIFGGGAGAGTPSPPAPLLADGQSAVAPLTAPSEQDMRRANAYLLHHARHAAVSARPAAMPFVNALAHDERVRTAAVPRRED